MAKSPSAVLKALSPAMASANVNQEGIVEQRRSHRVQQLSKFALTAPLRNAVTANLRKRSIQTGGGEEREVQSNKTVMKREHGTSMSMDETKVRSIRSKRSPKIIVRDGLLESSSCVHSSSSAGGEAQDATTCSSNPEAHRRLDSSFFECDALELAPKLLGKLIRRDDVTLRITEVEAYRPNDTACHARVGKTVRTEPLFGPAGHAYVYLCYGLHVMLNVVADRVDVGAAVLIRACSPVTGLKTIQARRGQMTEKPVLLTGPGKVGQALGLKTDWTNHPLYTPGGLEILDAPLPDRILVGPRVGIDYAEPKDVAALWRFALADTPWVSAPRGTLCPMETD